MSAEQEQLHAAQRMGMEVWGGAPAELDEVTARLVPFTWVKRHQVLPVHREGEVVWVAMAAPGNAGALEELRLLLDGPIYPVYCPADLLVDQMERRYRSGGAATHLQEQDTSEEIPGAGEVDLLDDAQDAPAVRFLNAVLAEAIQEGVSDLHFDPAEKGLRIRFRMDGQLQERHMTSREFISPLLTRLKVLSRLDIAEHRLPQDGRMRIRVAGRESDFRVSTIPCLGGERVVLRLLDKGHVALGLHHLEMPAEVLQGMRRCLHRSEGMILVTGPTGSGKTTTLYSAVQDLLSAARNIMTIEDPIEVRLPGIAQIQVQPKIGFGFAEGLRHILRQDPDIVLVGEIRDGETAQIAVQAALTGHLVLSTLHTNDAPSAVARLVELGVEPYLVASALQGVLAQRLVRRLCPQCRRMQPLDPTEQQEWALPEGEYWIGAGCADCHGAGFRGRTGIYEWLTVGERLQHQILQSQDSVSLRALARQEGMRTLRQHALQLSAAGITSASEVARVTAPEAR